MRALSTLLAGAVAVAAGACGPVVGPVIDHVDPVSAPVGVELALRLHGRAADGAVSFDFAGADLPDLKTRRLAATLVNYAQGEALFRWTPLATDVGAHEVDFRARGTTADTLLPVTVTVVAGSGAPPIFREPAGDGTVLDLAFAPCADVDVLVDDPLAASVQLAIEPPVVPGFTLTASGPTAGSLRFCPTDAQVTAQTVYPLTLSADDLAAPKVVKPYVLVVRPKPQVTCTTLPPQIAHTPHGDITTTGNLHIVATLSDDIGVVGGSVRYTTTMPADPKNPDLSTFTRLEMALRSGGATSGSWEAIIPNPVLNLPSGSTRTIYYVVLADDDDLPLGCAHHTRSPTAGVWSFVVKRP